jgi:intraflagellar transport protein 80
MKLKVTEDKTKHSEICVALSWSSASELFTCSDDHTILRWQLGAGMEKGTVAAESTDEVMRDVAKGAYVTDMHWFPSTKKSAGGDIFVASYTDGSMRLLSKGGRVEKVVEGHQGAMVSVRWNYEGTAIATCGEDGVIKIWSRAGMLRSTLVQSEEKVYAMCWGPDSDQLLYSCGKHLVIKPLQPSAKHTKWKAHDAAVLKVDWNPVNDMIVSGGEDGRYKVWDSYGRQLYASSAHDHAITSVAWAPGGETFAAGTFNQIQICDQTGWTQCQANTQSGSVVHIAWTADGTHLAGAGGNGTVCFGQLLERRLEQGKLEVTLTSADQIETTDLESERPETLELRDRISNVSLGYGYLVVATLTQICVYERNAAQHEWSTPHIVDLKDTPTLLLQCERYFLVVDSYSGLQIYNYEGRPISNPKFAGLRTEFLNQRTVALANDYLAIIDRADPKQVRVVDVASGKLMQQGLVHSLDVLEVGISQYGPALDRKIYVLDRNHDLYIAPANAAAQSGGQAQAGQGGGSGAHALVKIASMVDCAIWHDETEMLAAVADGKIVVWYYPNVVFIDKDITPLTKEVHDATDFGKTPSFLGFSGSRVVSRRTDGTTIVTGLSPFPPRLYGHVKDGNWEHGIRLCRYVQDEPLWACLAAMAINGRELNAAEVAYAAINAVEKVQFVLHIKEIPTNEGRHAELALFRRMPYEAEAILLQSQLYYRAIKMWIRLFNWERALELAVRHKTHVDTVLMHRQRYLAMTEKEESSKLFVQYSNKIGEIDEEVIESKVRQEKERERQRPDAREYK